MRGVKSLKVVAVISTVAILLAALALKARTTPPAPDDVTYDIVIANGHVMDPESGLDEVRNMGITAGKIRALSTTPLKAKSTLDAKGLVVAPGFIDLHEHGQDPATINFRPTMESPLRSNWKSAPTTWTPGTPPAKTNPSSISASASATFPCA